MVQAGMTGVADVFDGEPSFFSVFGTMSDPAVVFGDLGSTYAITETDIKRWSVGSPIQAALDALDVLVPGPPPAPADIASIVVHLPEEGARIVDGRNMPSVNVQHLVALRLVDGSLDFDSSHDIARMNDADVLEMRAKVRLAPSAELSAAEPARQAIVEIELRDGSVLRHHTRLVRGTARNRMDRDQLAAKAVDLMSRRIGGVRAAQACDAVWNLDRANDLTQLITILNEE
jgi:2-methylcitrate dehydratase PrpD